MQVITILYLTLGIALIWKASEALEKYSVLTAQNFNISPFIIGSTVIALGTSAPEIFTTLFAALNNQGNLIVGNVVGSNIANLSLVFGLTLFILGVKKKVIQEKSIELKWNLLTLISASIIMYVIFLIRPFAILSSIILISSLFLIIVYWSIFSTQETEKKLPSKTKHSMYKLLFSISLISLGAYLIIQGANDILEVFNVGEMFIGFTVVAIGTSLPEIAASIALSIKGRYETVAGTLIGSNIFNGLLVLAIPGLFNREQIMSKNWNFQEWENLLITLIIITIIFCIYMRFINLKPRKASSLLGLLFVTSYFISLFIAYN